MKSKLANISIEESGLKCKGKLHESSKKLISVDGQSSKLIGQSSKTIKFDGVSILK